MALDRDLEVAVATAAFGGRPFRIWDMLAASGVRGLRLRSEVPGPPTVVLSDANPGAETVLRQNAARWPDVEVRAVDARRTPPDAPYDLVDLDPYGSPLEFLDSAVPAVANGGWLAVTATDLMVLAGAQSGACERRYRARPVRGRLGPEGGLRILLATMARTARSKSRRMEVVLAYVRGHHVRAYVRLWPERDGAADPVGSIDPGTWTGPALGSSGPWGPMWLGPLFDPTFLERLTPPPTAARPAEVGSWIARMREESGIDRPFYYEANALAGALHLAEPPSLPELFARLKAHGFRSARTHMRPEGFRTDAPRAVVEACAGAPAP